MKKHVLRGLGRGVWWALPVFVGFQGGVVHARQKSNAMSVTLVLFFLLSMLLGGCPLDLPQGDSIGSITLEPLTPIVLQGGNAYLHAIGYYTSGTIAEVTGQVSWYSADSNIASVTAGGVISANNLGAVYITATAPGNITAKTMVTVTPALGAPAGASNLQVLTPQPVTTVINGWKNIVVTLPEPAVSMGIIALGSNADWKAIEHLGILSDSVSPSITGPTGAPITELAFNQIDFGDGKGERDYGDNLLNVMAEALYFPNGGGTATLAAGVYTFPVASIDAINWYFNQDPIHPYVLYKTSAPPGQLLKVNLWVVKGINGIQTQADAQADAEILGAEATLRTTYETQMGLSMSVNIDVIQDSTYATIDSQQEMDRLLMNYPITKTNDSLNLFIIDSFATAFLPAGVIGLSAGVPGPFNLQGTIVSGTLAEYMYDEGNPKIDPVFIGSTLGATLAHEFGHFLGLWHTSQTDDTQKSIQGHDPIVDTGACVTADITVAGGLIGCPDRNNLMFPISQEPGTTTSITTGQKTAVEHNPAVYVP